MSQIANSKPVTFIMTSDRAKSKAFYQDVLGLELDFEDGFAAVFKLAGASLRITEIKDYKPSAYPALGWDVEDIASSIKDITSRGVKMTIYEGFGQDELGIWHSPDGKAKVAWFNDVDGNVLSLTAC